MWCSASLQDLVYPGHELLVYGQINEVCVFNVFHISV